MKLVHISLGGPDRVLVDGVGIVWRFEDHPRCGPIMLNRRGDPKPTQPSESSLFWDAWKAWADQGKRLEGMYGNFPLCKWDEPPKPPRLVHLGGRNYAEEGSVLANKFGRGPAIEQKSRR